MFFEGEYYVEWCDRKMINVDYTFVKSTLLIIII